MSLTGENKHDIAMAVTYEGDSEIAMGGDMTKWFSHGMDPIYLTYLLNSPYGITCKQKRATGNIIVHISNGKLSEIPLPISPLAEQHRIVSKIEELLPYIDQYDKAYTKLTAWNKKFPEAIRQSILQYAMEGKLVEQRPEEGTAKKLLPEISEDEIPFEVPESWMWVRIAEICTDIVDCPHSTPKYFPQDTGFAGVDTNCINADGMITGWRYVTQDTYEKRTARLLPKGNDIVLTREGSIGRAAILPHGKKICLGQRVMLLRSSQFVHTELLRKFIMSPMSLSRLTVQQKGLGAKHINVSDICKLLIPLPPFTDQKRIVTCIEELFSYCEQLKEAQQDTLI